MLRVYNFFKSFGAYMDEYLIGIDVGTTGVKAAVFSSDGNCLGRAYQTYPTIHSALHAAEQLPSDWWNALVVTVRSACGNRETAGRVAALSLSAQGGTLVPTDASGNPLCPAFVWNDGRCGMQRLQYEKTFGSERMYLTSGWHAVDGLPAFQIKRLSDETPELFHKAALFLSVADYLLMKLTGKACVDFSNAGINQLIDVKKSEYDSDTLSWLGITEKQLPALVQSGQKIGCLQKEAARELGLDENVCVVAGAHDQYAAMLGAGAVSEGTVLIGAGTAWAACTLFREPHFETGFAQSRAASGSQWGSLASLSNGGVCLSWLNEKVFGGIPYEQINRNAAQKPVGSGGLCFYPQNADIGSLNVFFTGMHLGHDRYDMARAVMEGVSFQMSRILQRFALRTDIKKVVFSGGAAKSRFWSQLTCNMFGLPLSVPAMPDLPVSGAAVLAGAGCGIFASVKEGIKKISPAYDTYIPEEDKKELFANLCRQYQKNEHIIIK